MRLSLLQSHKDPLFAAIPARAALCAPFSLWSSLYQTIYVLGYQEARALWSHQMKSFESSLSMCEPNKTDWAKLQGHRAGVIWQPTSSDK